MKRSGPLERRQGLKRGAPLRRTGRLRRSRRRGDRPAVRAAYRASHSVCAVCGLPARPGFVLDVGHLLPGRYGRVDDPRNFLMLCRAVVSGQGCHDRDQGGGLTLPGKLAAKRRTDPDLYDRAFLQGLLGRPLPRAQARDIDV